MGLVADIRESRSQNKLLKEVLATEVNQNQFLEESISRLEAQMAEEGWRLYAGETERNFSRDGIDSIQALSRAMYLSHPLIQRAVNVTGFYTWAQGWEYQANDDRVTELVDAVTSDEGNRIDYYSHQARILTDLDQMVDGNVFLSLWTTLAGDVSVRSIPTAEMRDIITDSDDRTQVWFYLRRWVNREMDQQSGNIKQVAHECYHPDIRYQPHEKPESIGGIEVRWDAPVIHQKTGGLKGMQFGVPETYAALDWARSYRKFLEDWHTIVASLAKFAWRATTKGRKAKRVRNKLASGITKEAAEETNDAPGAGSVWIGSEADNLTPISKSGATTSAEDAKPSRLMVGAAMNLPDTILSGDPQQGNLATAKTLDRPTELGFINRQAMWRDFDQAIFRYCIDAKVRAGQLPGKVVWDIGGENSWVELSPDLDSSVAVIFPPILEHDVKESVGAIVSAATLDGKADAGTMPREQISRMLMSSIGVEDVDEAIANLDTEQQAQLGAAVESLSEVLRAARD